MLKKAFHKLEHGVGSTAFCNQTFVQIAVPVLSTLYLLEWFFVSCMLD